VPGPPFVVIATATPNNLLADGVSTSTVSALVMDQQGHTVSDGWQVDFTTTGGTVFPASASTQSGSAETTFTSSTTPGNYTITATVNGTAVDDGVDITLGTDPVIGGEPVNVTIAADPLVIQVKGTGGTSSSTITATVTDSNGNPYNDSDDNIRFQIIAGPGGGEVLDSADGTPSIDETTSTAGGVGTVILKSGTISGTLRIQVNVLKDGNGDPLVPQLTAISSALGIEAGPPFSMTMVAAPTVIDNEDGTISWIISSLVNDQYGNPVADDTGIYFGLVDNFKDGGIDGATTGGDTTFSSAGASFVTNGVVTNDTLIPFAGLNEGGHIVDTVTSATELSLFDEMEGPETGIPFVVGNAIQGVICGVSPTGYEPPDSTCTFTGNKDIKGLAHTMMTYPASAIWDPMYLYAETGGRTLGDSSFGILPDNYPAIEPVTVEVILSPTTVRENNELVGTQVTVFAHLSDGGGNAIQGKTLKFATSDLIYTGFDDGSHLFADRLPGVSITTDVNGDASVVLLVGGGTPPYNITGTYPVEVSVSIKSYVGKATLTIKP
jgi:hypothetical protein